MTTKTVGTTHTTVTLPGNVTSTVPSIRNIILTGLAIGATREAMEKAVTELHPESAGAKKFGKHLAWYRGKVKAGAIKLPEVTVIND